MTDKKIEFKRAFLDALEERVLIYDGAMGTNLDLLNLTPEDYGGEKLNGCNDHLILSKPEAVATVNRSFLEVGVDVIETNTFRSNRLTLAEFGLQDKTFEINQKGAALARSVADEFSTPDHPRFVAGSIGPTGKLPSADDPDLSNIEYDTLVDVFREQAAGLISGGADLLIVETSQDILEVKAAIQGIQLAFEETGIQIPLQCHITMDTTGRMLLGTDIASALTILERMPIDIVGMNCSTGPEHMRQNISYLGEHATIPVGCSPNAGLPMNVNGEAVFPLEPEPFANALAEFVEKQNVSIVGGCCGTRPEHLKLLVEKVGKRPAPKKAEKKEPMLSSPIKAVSMAQEPRPMLIGERLNATGSRKFKRLLLEEDVDAMVEIAREQINGGAHTLDVNVAVTERNDEAYLMALLVKRLEMGVDAPLVIDSTEPDVMEAALKVTPGRCLLNSTNLESGRAKFDRVMRLGKDYNAAVMMLVIDEEGMAKTIERKLAVADRMIGIAVDEFGFEHQDLVFDLLTFPLSTGDPEFADSAINTIESIRQLKAKYPEVLTSLGVSNVSFGLSKNARPVLNSMFLHHCVEAGLDMAIVHASKVRPLSEIPDEEQQLMNDLIWNTREDALQRVIEFYENKADVPEEEKEDPTKDMTPAERLHWSIVHRHKEMVEVDIDSLVQAKVESGAFPNEDAAAVDVLNNVLLPAMKEVGDKFGAGELILPFVLQSAEVMKKSVNHLENYLAQKEGVTKGTMVLATVYGDVHDIGKNLVKTILSNNGYTIVDLGKQVPVNVIVDKAEEIGADAIGLSALLVSTSKQMPLVVAEVERRGLNIPVLIGGAAINRRFGWRLNLIEEEKHFKPGVFYCKDAFESLELLNILMDEDAKAGFMQEHLAEVEKEYGKSIN